MRVEQRDLRNRNGRRLPLQLLPGAVARGGTDGDGACGYSVKSGSLPGLEGMHGDRVERASQLSQAGAALTPPESDLPRWERRLDRRCAFQAIFTGGATCLATSISAINGRRYGSSLGDARIDDRCG
jgi:hypothetical protein